MKERIMRMKAWLFLMKEKEVIWRRDWLKGIRTKVQFSEKEITVNEIIEAISHEIKISKESRPLLLIWIKSEDQLFCQRLSELYAEERMNSFKLLIIEDINVYDLKRG